MSSKSLVAMIGVSIALHGVWYASLSNQSEQPVMPVVPKDPTEMWIPVEPEPEPEKAPEPEPEPEKAPEAPPSEPQPKAPADPPPKAAAAAPEAAAAGKTLTAEGDDGPADFTLVQGAGSVYTGGTTTKEGKGKKATYAKNVGSGGQGKAKTGSRGKGPAVPAQGRSMASPARPTNANWSCSHLFPAEAEGTNHAVVQITVRVGANGRPRGVRVLADPGQGFGRAARMCALSQSYRPAKGPDGNAIAATTPPITITFRR